MITTDSWWSPVRALSLGTGKGLIGDFIIIASPTLMLLPPPVCANYGQFGIYSSPSVIRPPYLPRNCGHIREVAFGEREK